MKLPPFLFLATISLHTAFVSAEVVSVDFLHPGDGLLTRDTDQRLDFLDATESTNRSFSDVSSEFGLGGDFEGFRYATIAEIGTLINNFGFSPGASVLPDADASGDLHSDQLSVFVNMVGVTFTNPGGQAVIGLTSDVGPNGTLWRYDVTDQFPSDLDDNTRTWVSQSPSSAATTMGSWLVRDSTPLLRPRLLIRGSSATNSTMLQIDVINIPSGTTYHLRRSVDGETFLPLENPIDLDQDTLLVLEMAPDANRRVLYQIWSGPSG